ncbi:hypothetical protein P8H80_004234 [Escherichia coli]|nr:hypothetical protein [Escherichia coli]
MSDITPYMDQVADIRQRAARVLAFASIPQFKEGAFIKDRKAWAKSVGEATHMDPLFESYGPIVSTIVGTAWASALADYANERGEMPRDELLAAAHKATENLLLEGASKYKNQSVQLLLESAQKDLNENKFLFESADSANIPDLTTSQGIMQLATFVAMILPVALGAQTSDACTFVPCEKDQNKIFEIVNIAGNSFGDLTAGQEIDMTTSGYYSQMARVRLFAADQQPKGTKQRLTFKVEESEGVKAPIRPKRTVLYINRKPTDPDTGNNVLLHSFVHVDKDTGEETSITLTCQINYDTGEIAVNPSNPFPEGYELGVGYELDVEKAPSLIPTINHKMKDYLIYPSFYALAAEHTLIAELEMRREFNFELSSLSYRSLRDYISHEIDMMRLSIMIWRCIHSCSYDVALPDSQLFESWSGLLRSKFNQISADMIDRTRTTGVTGMFAGSEASNFIKALPPTLFQPAPNYRQTPYVHFTGTLFGVYKVFEVPQPICTSLTKNLQKNGAEFKTNNILCYGRGDGIAQAGFIAGDAIPLIPLVHDTTPQLRNRTTMFGSALNVIHPRRGEDYFEMLELTFDKAGALDPRSGKYIEPAPTPEPEEATEG